MDDWNEDEPRFIAQGWKVWENRSAAEPLGKHVCEASSAGVASVIANALNSQDELQRLRRRVSEQDRLITTIRKDNQATFVRANRLERELNELKRIHDDKTPGLREMLDISSKALTEKAKENIQLRAKVTQLKKKEDNALLTALNRGVRDNWTALKEDNTKLKERISARTSRRDSRDS